MTQLSKYLDNSAADCAILLTLMQVHDGVGPRSRERLLGQVATASCATASGNAALISTFLVYFFPTVYCTTTGILSSTRKAIGLLIWRKILKLAVK